MKLLTLVLIAVSLVHGAPDGIKLKPTPYEDTVEEYFMENSDEADTLDEPIGARLQSRNESKLLNSNTGKNEIKMRLSSSLLCHYCSMFNIQCSGCAPACSCGEDNRWNRINPWQVSLVENGGAKPFCVGTLISDRHVITAAHCTEGRSFCVEMRHKRWQSCFTVSSINNHPNYTGASGYWNYDISIITVKPSVPFSDFIVRPACLPFSVTNDYAGQAATVSGWGNGAKPALDIKMAQVNVQSNAQCNLSLGGTITSQMICADDGKDVCNQEDAGAPLVVKENGRYALIGVASWDLQCVADGRYPGVYTRVTSVLDWIQANTAGTQQSSC